MKAYIFIFAALCLTAIGSNAQFNCQHTKQLHSQKVATAPINNNGKSDTLNILHYHLDLDMTKVQSGQINGSCTISLSPKMANITRVSLDFKSLTVDSVLLNNTAITTYSHAGGSILGITLPSAFAMGDTFHLRIFYHGHPITDQSGWGGFHFGNPYFYNLGIGFASNPHNVGSMWFPCFDNFVEKSTYSFAVKTNAGRKAYCNGLRTQLDTSTFGGDTVVSHWNQTDPIPTYLASVAISDYQELSYTHNGMPFLILARAADTTNVRASFTNLPAIYDAEVAAYGPYFWQKVGYAITPIGSMEHATSIHLARSIANGSLTNEDIIAHELAHHWFGNLVTCETAGDMWINEGMAEYVSHQYQETVYNRERYVKAVLDNQAYVIQYAAVEDGGHFPLYGLSNELTYGKHTYQKGAMVGHNLRTYLGDSLFFNGWQTLMSSYTYSTINSYQLRDHLGPIAGYDLTSFFDDWVFNPGYPEFNIDSMRVIVSAIPEPTVKVGVSQRMRARNKRFTNVPLRISLRDSLGQVQHHEVMFSGTDTVYTLLNAFAPQWGNLNENAFLLDGTTYTDFNLKQPGINSFNTCKMDVAVTQITDSVNLRVEHHWAGPSRTGNEPFRISNSRYWRVTGHLTAGFMAEGRLEYSNSASSGNLDADLVSATEDSLMLVYRRDATQPWQEFEWYSKNYFGAPNNGYGRINIQVLIPGEYAFANGVSAFGLEENSKAENRIIAYPNPAGDSVTISFYPIERFAKWQITDMNGRQLSGGNLSKNQSELKIETANWPNGTYVFTLEGESISFLVN
jgi:aminopeptidase N